jgi:hypothetical protein
MEMDVVTQRIIAGLLAGTCLLCTVGGLVLAFCHIESPSWISTLAFTTATSLLAWFAPSPMSSKKATP